MLIRSRFAPLVVMVCVGLAGCTGGRAAMPSSEPSRATESPPSVAPSPVTLTCTIEGTAKADKLTGTPGDDVICGLGGDDTLRGGDGNDVLRGGLGDDALQPGPGEDSLDGGPGRDVVDYVAASIGITANLRAGTVTADGNDTVLAIERLIGSAFDDAIIGSIGDDSIDAGDGNDTLRLAAGDDVANGGKGNDILLGAEGIDTCVQGPGEGKVACERTWVPVDFATVGKVTLSEPAQDPMLIAYHESLFKSAAAMDPVGDKKEWLVQGSRGRGTPATSAADIPLKPGTPVVSPVDGTVIDVIDYQLYCEASDTLVVIRPDADRKVSVIVMHLVDVPVQKGDEVVAGGTLLGVPHVFPGGTNQVDAYVPGSPPHVHIEVESDGSKVVPGCDFARDTDPKEKG